MTTTVAVAAGLLALPALAGCGAPGGSAPSAATARPSGPVSTDPATAGKVTLTEWDQNTDPATDASTRALNAAFERRYPNVRIVRVSRSFNDLKTTLKLALSSANPPDVVQANQGYPDMGAFVKAGMLTPLDRYADAYGWRTAYPKQLLDLNRFSTDGRSWTTGSLYGISQTGEVVGVYYDKTELAALGLQPPRTLADLGADLAKAKAAGKLPLSFGDSDKTGAIHLFGVVQALTAGKVDVRHLVFGAKGASWTDSGTVRAATTIGDWAKAGYLSPGWAGQTSDQAATEFGAGKSVFYLDGTWEAQRIASAMGAGRAGFTALSPSPGASPLTEGGEGLAWSITSKSRHPDVAAAYLNFLNDEGGMAKLASAGGLPALPPPSFRPAAGTVAADVLTAWHSVSTRDGLLPYLDYTTPTFYDTLTAGLQELLGGRQTPQQFTRSLQTDDSAFQQSR
ncbi:extracellular solute-binding protein [Phaeacidiphilus oryzae]|uniref:extracellular solute-binding protein n=1 Tax=Phaeacidiphilus oryzae TaxID=348818 RepID=UPI000565D414|nr:extracellular solute-binding protein [Phaeacidiphilus oryzae]